MNLPHYGVLCCQLVLPIDELTKSLLGVGRQRPDFILHFLNQSLLELGFVLLPCSPLRFPLTTLGGQCSGTQSATWRCSEPWNEFHPNLILLHIGSFHESKRIGVIGSYCCTVHILHFQRQAMITFPFFPFRHPIPNAYFRALPAQTTKYKHSLPNPLH